MASGPYNYSYIFKYIIIGDMGVGKSCLLHQFTEKKCKYYVASLTCFIYFSTHGYLFLVVIVIELYFWIVKLPSKISWQ